MCYGRAAVWPAWRSPSRASPLLAAGFYAYFDNMVPLLGALFNGSREAYTYLPTSLRYFPDAPTLRA